MSDTPPITTNDPHENKPEQKQISETLLPKDTISSQTILPKKIRSKPKNESWINIPSLPYTTFPLPILIIYIIYLLI